MANKMLFDVLPRQSDLGGPSPRTDRILRLAISISGPIYYGKVNAVEKLKLKIWLGVLCDDDVDLMNYRNV